jgi:hypothetical protein
MLSSKTRKNLNDNGCTIEEQTDLYTIIDCEDFKINKYKGEPWQLILPFKEMKDYKQDLDLDFPVKKISTGFWEKIDPWGRMKGLTINDEMFIDIDEKNVKEIDDDLISSKLERIEKLKNVMNKTEVKNINIRSVIQDSIKEIGDHLSNEAEQLYGDRTSEVVICEPEVQLIKPWIDGSTQYSYKINIVCVIPHISTKIKKRILDFGDLSIIRDKKTNFIRSIFPIKEKIYLNEIVFNNEEEKDITPYISFVMDKKFITEKDFGNKVRSVFEIADDK